MLPSSLLKHSENSVILAELKNGDSYRGLCVRVDRFMNLHLRDVTVMSPNVGAGSCFADLHSSGDSSGESSASASASASEDQASRTQKEEQDSEVPDYKFFVQNEAFIRGNNVKSIQLDPTVEDRCKAAAAGAGSGRGGFGFGFAGRGGAGFGGGGGGHGRRQGEAAGPAGRRDSGSAVTLASAMAADAQRRKAERRVGEKGVKIARHR